MSDNYLIHYGVQGMKWGVRRYQEQRGNSRQSRKNNNALNKQIYRQNKSSIRSAQVSRATKRTYRVANKKAYRTAKLANTSAGKIVANNLLKSIGADVILGISAGLITVATGGAAASIVIPTAVALSTVNGVVRSGIALRDINEMADSAAGLRK